MTTTRTSKLFRLISDAIVARQNCLKSGNEWAHKWDTLLENIARNCLPRGSGIDCGTTIDLDKSNGAKIVLSTSYHHMNDGGFYDGWTKHEITVTPSFQGIDLRISGRNRNEIKDYLHEVFHQCLTSDVIDDSEQNVTFA